MFTFEKLLLVGMAFMFAAAYLENSYDKDCWFLSGALISIFSYFLIYVIGGLDHIKNIEKTKISLIQRLLEKQMFDNYNNRNNFHYKECESHPNDFLPSSFIVLHDESYEKLLYNKNVSPNLHITNILCFFLIFNTKAELFCILLYFSGYLFHLFGTFNYFWMKHKFIQ